MRRGADRQEVRLRQLLAWTLVPCLAVAAVAAPLLAQAIADERGRTVQMAQGTLTGAVVNEAAAAIAGETAALVSLEALDGLPGQLSYYETSAAALRGAFDRRQLLTNLDTSDASGARTLRRLAAVGIHDADLDAVLGPLPDDVRADIGAGRTHTLPGTRYADALAAIQTFQTSSTARSDAAADALLELGDGHDYWRSAAFARLALALAAVAAVGGLAGAWRLTASAGRLRRTLADEQARADSWANRTARLHAVLGTARRLASGTDAASLQLTLVRETRELLGGASVALYLATGDRYEPVARDGTVPLAAVARGEGVVGRCADGATTERAVLARDPALVTDGPSSVLCAPLVADGQVVGALLAARPDTELFADHDETALQMLALVAASSLRAAQRHDSTVALASNDALTGLGNRRRLDADLAGAAGAAAAAGAGLAFVMLDLDHFKAYNDRHGHPAGDELLRRVSRAVEQAVREADTVYRYGGEELCVLLPGAGLEEATAVAERVRAAVAATTPPTGEPVTVSAGVAAATAPLQPADLVAAADAALYEAKRAGRNRVEPATAR